MSIKEVPEWVIPNRWHGEAEYYGYIASPEWMKKVRGWREERGNRCALCATTVNLQAHHNSYENLGHESPFDIAILCGKHHAEISRFVKPKMIPGFRKGRKFFDKRHCIEETTLFVLWAVFFWSWFFDNTVSDEEQRGYEFAKFVLGNNFVETLNSLGEQVGPEEFIKVLPRVGYRVGSITRA